MSVSDRVIDSPAVENTLVTGTVSPDSQATVPPNALPSMSTHTESSSKARFFSTDMTGFPLNLPKTVFALFLPET